MSGLVPAAPGHIHASYILLSGGVNRRSLIARRLQRFVNTPCRSPVLWFVPL